MINKHYMHSDDYDRSAAVTRVKKSEVSGAKRRRLNNPALVGHNVSQHPPPQKPVH
jgi:hypothetical protein